jgi:hypothetical protein
MYCLSNLFVELIIYVGQSLNSCVSFARALIAFSTIFAEMLVAPPWSWPATNVGLINIGAVVAALRKLE